MPKVSICIPTFECGGQGDSYLTTLLNSISSQTYSDIEIVVSDHSESLVIKELCETYSMNIIYLKNTNHRGSSESNLNNAIKAATGDFIKPMYQDDFFHSDNAIEVMVNKMEEESSAWAAAATWHCQDQDSESLFYHHPPTIPPNIESWLTGNNTLGSPSVVMYRATEEYLDPFLVWFPDVEFYYRMWKKYGNPSLVTSSCVVTRLRIDGITNTEVTPTVVEQETQYNLKTHFSPDPVQLEEYPIIYSRAKKLNLL